MATKVKKQHEFKEGTSMFDEDIRGLHRIVQPTNVLDKKVKYIKPGLPQAPYMISFLIEAFKDLIMTPDEISSLNRNDIFSKVISYVGEVTAAAGDSDEEISQESQAILGSAFGSKAAIDYLIPVLQQCFPDIHILHCTNDAFIECFNIVFSDMFED